MRLEVSRWRNKQVWNAGLSHLWTSGMDSGQLLFNLKEEVLFLPMNFADSFSRPFIRDFRTASLQHKVGKTVGLWLFQAILLVGILWFFMLISTLSLNALIKFQRAFVPMLKHPKPQKVANALFWFIKPNAYWLTLSLFSYWVITVIPEDWFLLQWLGPMGMLFAGYRAMRVIVEWTLVHTYTRSGKFLSPVISNKITTSSRHLASGLVACAVLLMGVSGTGGGELLFLLIGILLVLAWFTVAYVESMHQDAVHPFVLSVAKQIGVLSAEKAKQIHIDKMGHLTKIIYPLIYSLAFWVDILFVLHERLMFFDVYRAISVKILRIRLATQDEVEEQEEQPSDFRYRDWLLRPISERAPRIDIAFDKALVPLQVWVDNKSDDNCLLVLGDRGMGKSELAQNLSSALPEMPFKILSVDTKVLSAKELFDLLSKHIGHSIESIAELVKVDETTEKQVIVIENACNLFLSEVGCLDGYRALIDIMNAHLKNLFWVVLMHEPSWNYLKYVFEKEQRFSNVYRMPKWSALEIRKLILSRHQGSQLRIKYDEMLVSASARSESASVRSADSSVFNILWEQSGGNPLVAMQIWLESANSNGRILNVGVPSRPSSDQLNTASEDALFVYAALMFHKELTVPEIMRVSHFTESVVRQALKFGLNTGFIQKIASGYMVDTLWQNVLTLYLQRKNYLW
jgi:predicted transcriptional regulator